MGLDESKEKKRRISYKKEYSNLKRETAIENSKGAFFP